MTFVLDILLPKVELEYVIWGALLRVQWTVYLCSLPNWMIGRRAVMSVDVKRLFLTSCFSTDSLRVALSINFPHGWLPVECSRLHFPPSILITGI